MREHIIHYQSDQAINPPITMHINTSILRQQITHEDKPFVDHGNERIRALAPGIAVGDFFEDIGLLGKGVRDPVGGRDLDVHLEIRAYVEGGIDVNQFQPALGLDLFPQWSVLQ